jgi:hypothetical protein
MNNFNSDGTTTGTPWRMILDVDATSEWQTVRVPLLEMTDWGAWLNDTGTLLPPSGGFSWKNATAFQIVAENSGLEDVTLLFDSIAIAGDDPKGGGLSGGAVAGIVIGVIAAVALAAVLGFVLYRRHKRPAKKKRRKTKSKKTKARR